MKRQTIYLIKCVLTPILLSIITAVTFKPAQSDIGQNILLLVYKNVMHKIYYIGQMIMITSPNIVFSVIFGNFVYKYFKSDGIYEITRYKSRFVFMLKKQLELILCCLVYHLVYYISLFFYVCILTPYSVSLVDIKTALIIFILSFSVSLSFAVLSNALSFYLGEHNGFIFNSSIFAFFCVYALWKKQSSAGLPAYLNPINNYILIWHDSSLIEKNDLWELYGIPYFSVGYSLLTLLIFNVILFIILIVSGIKTDISISLKEEL